MAEKKKARDPVLGHDQFRSADYLLSFTDADAEHLEQWTARGDFREQPHPDEHLVSEWLQRDAHKGEWVSMVELADVLRVPVDATHRKIAQRILIALGCDSADTVQRFLYEVHGILPGDPLPVANLDELLEGQLRKKQAQLNNQMQLRQNTDSLQPAVPGCTVGGSAISEGGRDLTVAQQDILGVVREAGHRMTTKQLLEAIARKGKIASVGTTKSVLAELTRHNLLTNRQDVRPKGYGLPEWE